MRISDNAMMCSLLLLAASSPGCRQQPAATPVTTDVQQDVEHAHEHIHGHGHRHDHEHSDQIEGPHSHPHAHPHRHAEALHGGRIVSIRHTHHRADATHYHAEVLPLQDRRLTLCFLTESPAGDLQEQPIAAAEFTALIGREGTTPISTPDVTFVPEGTGETAARFSADLPADFAEGGPLRIVVPSITLGGERLSFSFSVAPSAPAPAAAQPQSDGELP
jgi:hypothetical protein